MLVEIDSSMNYVLQVYTISKSNLLLEILLIKYRKLSIIIILLFLLYTCRIYMWRLLIISKIKGNIGADDLRFYFLLDPKLFWQIYFVFSRPIICGFAINILCKHIFRMAPIGTTGLSYLKMLKFIYFDIFGLLRIYEL